MSRVPSQKTILLPVDHGITLGPKPGLEVSKLRNLFSSLAKQENLVQGLIVHRGLALHNQDLFVDHRIPWLLHLSASTILGDRSRKSIVTSVEDAIKLGADGVSVHVNLGTSTETDMVTDLGNICSSSSHWGMPVLAMMYADGANAEERGTVESVAHAARVAYELGADIVKIVYPGSTSAINHIADYCSCPIFVAGGSFSTDESEILNFAQQVTESKAAGFCMGRNVFQRQDAISLLGKIRNMNS